MRVEALPVGHLEAGIGSPNVGTEGGLRITECLGQGDGLPQVGETLLDGFGGGSGVDDACHPQEAERVVKSPGHGQGFGHERQCSISEGVIDQLRSQDGEQVRPLAAVVGPHGFESCLEDSHTLIVHLARFAQTPAVVRQGRRHEAVSVAHGLGDGSGIEER